jgi:hypothetical protein
MKEPSAKRQRTLALHDRALRFSNSVNISCPQQFTNKQLSTQTLKLNFKLSTQLET